ncbi:unnamed protein product [Closterium sp. Yama58-4]|nr:unnamed protein product [Closterium sp. Yama58-4]
MRRFSRRLPQVVVFFLILSPAPTTAPNESSNTLGRDDVPPDATDVPPDVSAVPPDASAVPPDVSAVPPDASAVPPDASVVPPDAVDVPPDASAVPPDAVDVPPDPTDVPPDASDVPADASVGGSLDEEGYMEATPEVKQLVARLERVAGTIKNPWEVLMHLDQLFAADAPTATLSAATPSGAVGAASSKVSPLATGPCPATKAQMLKEVSRLAWRLHFRPVKYTIMGRFFRKIAINAKKYNSDLRYLGCRTYLIPSNFAFMSMIAKSMNNATYLLLAPLYNTINATYHFNKLRRMRHGATMPTLIPGYPIAKYFTPVTPLALLTLGGSIVAVGTPGAKTVMARLGWAQIKDRDLHCGKYMAAHGVSTLVYPRIKIPK